MKQFGGADQEDEQAQQAHFQARESYEVNLIV